MLRTLIVIVFAAVLSAPAWSQADPAGSAGHTWQVGAGFSFGPPDFSLPYLKSATFYASYDIENQTGVIVEAHLMNFITHQDIGERSFMFGARYGFVRSQFHFYIKALIGLGMVEYQKGIYSHTGNDSYEAFGVGGGVEYLAAHHLNVRLFDFEYSLARVSTAWIDAVGRHYRGCLQVLERISQCPCRDRPQQESANTAAVPP